MLQGATSPTERKFLEERFGLPVFKSDVHRSSPIQPYSFARLLKFRNQSQSSMEDCSQAKILSRFADQLLLLSDLGNILPHQS
jgi:hypothetical protein